MILLAFETSADFLSVAVASDSEILGYRRVDAPRKHAEKIVPSIRSILDETGIHRRHIDAVAVSTGPGSYTGLRIGVSTAKGYTMALGCKLIGVSTLSSMVYLPQVPNPESMSLLALIPARADEWYFGSFPQGAGVTHPSEAGIVKSSGIQALTTSRQTAAIITTNAGKVNEAVAESASTLEVHEVELDAKGVVAAARKMFSEGDFADADLLEPDYLRKHNTVVPGDVFQKLRSKLS